MKTYQDVRDFLEKSQDEFSVRFIKRGTTRLREMRCKKFVKEALKGGEQSYIAKDYLLVNVFDLDANHYKCFPLDGLKEILLDGEWHEVVPK
jgi:hypothetical protein